MGTICFALLSIALLRYHPYCHRRSLGIQFSTSSTNPYDNNHDGSWEEEYKRSAEQLHQSLQSKNISGSQKHQLHCEHRYRFGRQPNVCENCWTYRDICLCHKIRPVHTSGVVSRIVFWTHHKEWGSPSNTGKLVNQCIGNSEMLLKGLDRHDERLDIILSDASVFPIALWTKDDTNQKGHQTHKYMSTKAIVRLLQERPIVLIVIDGTWRQARRMVNKLNHVPRLCLERSELLQSQNALRKPKSDSVKVNTAQATISALFQLGALDLVNAQSILNLVDYKMIATIDYQGKTKMRFLQDSL